MYTQCSDAEIIEFIKKDDATAFSALHQRYARSCHNVAFKITKDLQAAEDIVQDIFMSLWKNRATHQIEDISKYLFTCTKYGAIRFLSKSKRTYMPGEQMPEQATGKTPEDIYNSKFLMERLHAEINKLPEKCRTVFIDSKLNGFSAKQIAEERGLSPRTVEKQLETGMGKVKKSLEKVATLFFLAIAIFF
ncbi:RNA polymerase sigma-70 factor, ECF subfamily [Filimonas lacunae]|uniref:RNA polymerase sigma-70 factor, ECF subfamily n=1 Tax=Filimonas lacunae TaxID=477680 RepID=A0A173MQZ7_9BACT|nr:sigma-70 family RNA polymerase sigma factor [Filimonas lacunae]BAV10082.1 RNA polymerase ECF-type sigma factor [Filimonas lacunae]SIS83730.1 RNA polymerase sigma-70 factor, ECF subfamily [Filimonas lacunae]